jgi:CRISPR-associated protein Csx10
MGNEVETLDYVPGTALRGLLADEYLRRGGAADAAFRRLFCSDDVRFPNLYPTNVLPVPRSAHTCKRRPGFLQDGSGDLRGHGVWDLLFEACPGFAPTALDRRHDDGACGGPLKPLPAAWYKVAGDPTSAQPPRQLLMMKTAVGPHGSALEASLHSQHELAADQLFSGTLEATPDPDDPARPLLWELLERLGMARAQRPSAVKFAAYTGRRRAGQLELHIKPPRALTPRGTGFLDTWPAANADCFALTFLSDVILVDFLLRPVESLDGFVLRNHADEKGHLNGVNTLSVIKAFVATRRVSGWNAVARLFKADDLAMARGSTFLLKVDGGDKPKALAWMQHVAVHGIGLRRAEGFGRVGFNLDFHRAAAQKNGGPL